MDWLNDYNLLYESELHEYRVSKNTSDEKFFLEHMLHQETV